MSDGSDESDAGTPHVDDSRETDGPGTGDQRARRVFEATVRDGVCRLSRPGTRWLSTGWNGGESRGPAAYNVTVPDGWPETDLATYVESRRTDAGFDAAGPTLLTGVSQDHARRAHLDGVEAVVTAGVSNPAALPVDGAEEVGGRNGSGDHDATGHAPDDHDSHVGTVNVFAGTTRALDPGALPNPVAVAAEAKAATFLAVAGVPGTTTDAVVAACDPAGPRERFSGSATTVGRLARACVRDALLASLDSRYDREDLPTVETAEHGVVTDCRATVERL
ncbi:adenosylcobinamide amidohydrolase [Salinigranum salinum]|uniref:adenosylcobinamide amidohydrolase n=1 Tax=Salinigranum salinum TaxID=1364937 RepID=UPI0012606FAD|nr:adenosylcobinamide amidohydrolase [Salinigranum salinum]